MYTATGEEATEVLTLARLCESEAVGAKAGTIDAETDLCGDDKDLGAE